ncbi:hypothetical protein ACQKWADRAFT_328797 [Trichoderma austrokoningii]
MSLLFSKRQHLPALYGLPRNIRLLILEALVEDGHSLSRLATVSREWQAEVERYNFARIKLTPSRLVDFGSMVYRNRALVKYIWFCLELEEYDRTKCAPTGRLTEDEMVETYAIIETNHGPITTAFENLFSVLSAWDSSGDLTLDIYVYSHGDSKHWFEFPASIPDMPFSYDRSMVYPVRDQVPFDGRQLELQWWDQLPPVPAVTKLLLHQQNYRRWRPDALARLFALFPRLEELYYEPWREWTDIERDTDRRHQCLFRSIQRSNVNLKRLVIFENLNEDFNQKCPTYKQRLLDRVGLTAYHRIRNAAPYVIRMVALASLGLEHLAASFIVDASYFFKIEPSWEWPNLTSLALTSKLLTPDENPNEIGVLFQAAVTKAMKMPRLETMEIWNGRRGLAALFKYQAFRSTQHATITWRGTWDFTMEPSTVRAWEDVIHRQTGDWRLYLVQDRLSEADIKSHDDAIHHLKLSSQVVRPISLQKE